MDPSEMRDREPGRFAAWITTVFGARPGEYTAAAWSFTYFFCVLGSYYMLRPVREAMAVASGPDTIPYLFAGTFVTMLMATPIFGWVSSRFPRRQFLPWVYTFFILNILAFWGAFGMVVGLITSPMKAMMLPGLLIFILICVFLFRPVANEYFAGTDEGSEDSETA